MTKTTTAAAVLLAMGGLTGAVNAQPQGGIEASLEAAQYVGEGQDVVVSLKLTNTAKHPIKVLKWYTPADGLEDGIFKISRDGQAVPYQGPHYKRPAPSEKDYVKLAPGESLNTQVELSAYYDLSESGSYDIQYDVEAMGLIKNKGQAKKAERLAEMKSNTVSLWVDGLEFKGAGSNKGKPGSGDGGGSTDGVSFQGRCSNSQQSEILTALSAAGTISTDALDYLQGHNSPASSVRYDTWFGSYDAGRWNTVTNNFSAIKDAIDNQPLTFDCSCKKQYFAYVYPTQPYVVYLCSAFWSAPNTGTDSRAGTIVHELSHFNVVAGTDDLGYGHTNAKALADSDPNKAIQNADSHEYFAENTPVLP
ncbi:M35 family metallo-endopeptidase [Gallaecimonas sp. GXIMD4217]|uniref:M35 family metallo-endopeptidase n=1 Tax=Gallaecimonas sp. GXIMD4217 TaxID=3131927 RepID=UPI00311B3B1C